MITIKMVGTKKWSLPKTFSGEAKNSDFVLVEEELRELKDGEVLFEALCWSVDPYMKAYSARFKSQDVMMGSQVSKVVASNNPGFKVGDNFVTYFGWRTHTIYKPEANEAPSMQSPMPVPDLKGLPVSLALGAIGMPGNTAYFGFLELCTPKPGDVVVVTGAAGAVGSLVGQIAKIKGCTVIGFAGSTDKCKWLKEELGFDFAFNYKTDNVYKSLMAAAPKGVNCYFDNVGGTISSTILSCMADFGRVSVCGAISSYNDQLQAPQSAPVVQGSLVFHQLKMEGFLVHRWTHRWMEGLKQMRDWIKEDKIKFRETVHTGFEEMPNAFISMMNGGNTGKMIINAK